MRILFVALFFLFSTFTYAQQTAKGIVVDSLSRQPLPFATVQAGGQKTVIATIGGKFSIAVSGDEALRISYSGHASKTVSPAALNDNDTVLLAPLSKAMDEVVIRTPADKIRRIVNTAIKARPLHNPDQYASYECNVYYKMIVDIEPYGNYNMDSIQRRDDSLRLAHRKRKNPQDTARKAVAPPPVMALPSHLFLTETYSKRQYKKPGQTQEVLLASRFSGLSKTYVANVITDVLPFHVYTDYIPLNGIDFINPLAKGWQSRYRFALEDELLVDGDTVFILRYRPKAGTSFHSLTGLLYISSKGYAVTHFTGTNSADSAVTRIVKFEHIYQHTGGRWFPLELNYDFGIRKTPAVYSQIVWNGRSVIDSVRFDQTPTYKFDKAHPLKFGDSIDRHKAADWGRFRRDSLSLEEANTYRNMDSLMRSTPMEKFILLSARIATGRLPLGKVDLDTRRLLAANRYEGTRLGLGLYTNNSVSKHYSLCGWAGYGFRDKVWKWGGSFTLYPKGGREHWLSFAYRKDYRLTGQVNLHSELSRAVLQNWLLQQVDEIREYSLSANIKPGYWELRPAASRTDFGPLHYAFLQSGKTVTAFTAYEATLGLRYAYGEKRVPFFEYYLSQGTRYPVVYASLGRGRLSAGGQNTSYTRALAAVTFAKHLNRWGKDRFRLEAGLVQTRKAGALPRSLLLAGNGFRRGDLTFYAWGGFFTMRPFDFYADRYLSFLYRHDLDKNLWTAKWSKPFVSLAHNLIYGGLQPESKAANPGISTYGTGYHESGLLLNRLLRYNLGVAEAGLNVGAFYHWQKDGNWRRNGVFVIGLTTGF